MADPFAPSSSPRPRRRTGQVQSPPAVAVSDELAVEPDPMEQTSSGPPPDAFLESGTPVAAEVYDLPAVDAGPVTATDGDESGSPAAPDAATAEDGVLEPGAENGAGDAGETDDEPNYDDDEPDDGTTIEERTADAEVTPAEADRDAAVAEAAGEATVLEDPEPEDPDGSPLIAGGPDEDRSYSASAVPTGAKAVVSWIAGAEDRDDERARAEAARQVEAMREDGVRQTVADRVEKALGDG